MLSTRTLLICCLLVCLLPVVPGSGQTGPSRKPEIIRDTDIAEGIEKEKDNAPKQRSPEEAEKNINIGNYYFKNKNYNAAIERYQTAIEYQPDSVRAYESLVKAYEKDGQIDKAIHAIEDFLKANPDSKKCKDLKEKVAKLQAKLGKEEH
jgi:tetratricopeptide (TPR) repeat protein